MEVWPALDVADGRVVRLLRGDFGEATIYSAEPLAYVHRRFDGFPRRLHLVDLDGAKNGSFSLYPLVESLAKGGTRVEVGGGFRTTEDVARAFDAGASRVVVGSQLVRDPEFRGVVLQRFGAGMVAGLDVKHGRLRLAGWREAGPPAMAFWKELRAEGWDLLQVTDIGRDGTLSGVRKEFWRQWAGAGGFIGAGGGISGIEDLRRLQNWGLAGAVVGKAWIEGRVPIEELM